MSADPSRQSQHDKSRPNPAGTPAHTSLPASPEAEPESANAGSPVAHPALARSASSSIPAPADAEAATSGVAAGRGGSSGAGLPGQEAHDAAAPSRAGGDSGGAPETAPVASPAGCETGFTSGLPVAPLPGDGLLARLRWRLQGMLDWLYPVFCLKCGCSLLGQHSPGLCPECEKQIVPLTGRLCRRCGSLLSAPASGQSAGDRPGQVRPTSDAATNEAETGGNLPSATGAPAWQSGTVADGLATAGAEDLEEECLACCPHCAGSGARYTRAAGAVRYLSPARDLVHDFKYNGNCLLADFFAPQMVLGLRRAGLPQGYDCIIPVPLHRRRLRLRGYNQALLLARGVAREVSGALRPGLLKRIRFTPAQALTAPADRARNIAGAFRVRGTLTGASVLLIDDVMTTGATVNECARELRKAGAARVYVLVWAR